jgi:hypothetical protein
VRKGYSKNENEIQKKAAATMRSLQFKKNRITDFFENKFVQYAKLCE